MKEVDMVFDEMERGAISGRSFMSTIIQLGMCGVIIFSLFVWFKLNAYESKHEKF